MVSLAALASGLPRASDLTEPGARGMRRVTSVPSPGTELTSAEPPRSRSRPQIEWLTPSRPAAAAVASRPGFKQEMDQEALDHLFPQNRRLAALAAE